MSQGSAPIVPQTTVPMSPELTAGQAPYSTGVAPGAAAQNQPTMPETPGMWAAIESVLGKTATDFVNMLGDNPEERATNLEAFTKTMQSINAMSEGLGQTTLLQRMGAQRGKEMAIQAQQSQVNPAALQPLPPMSDEMVRSLLEQTGMASQAISNITRPR